jgi:hypothetical protein
MSAYVQSLRIVLVNIHSHRFMSVSSVTMAETKTNLCHENGSERNWKPLRGKKV